MKKTKSFLKIALLLVSCFILSSSISAAPSKKTVTLAYRSYCAQNKYKAVKQLDIDGNGIRDLVYQNHANYGVCTYDSKTKKVIKLASADMGRSYGQGKLYYRKGYFFLYHLDTQSYTFYRYRIKGKKITNTKTFHADLRNYRYYVNGRPVSNRLFTKYINTIHSYKCINLGYM